MSGDLVVNINLMDPQLLVRPRFALSLPPSQVAVAASAGRLPIRDSAADTVVAHHFPIQWGHLVDGPAVEQLALEISRVLRMGGTVEFQCSSCDPQQLDRAFRHTGLVPLEPSRAGRVLRLRKAETP